MTIVITSAAFINISNARPHPKLGIMREVRFDDQYGTNMLKIHAIDPHGIILRTPHPHREQCIEIHREHEDVCPGCECYVDATYQGKRLWHPDCHATYLRDLEKILG